MTRQWLALTLALGLCVAFTDGASAQIKLGVGGPITGGSATFGAQLKNGVNQAIEDVNSAGGINGQKIRHLPSSAMIAPIPRKVFPLPTSSWATG